jgi:hypothetical protein
MYTPNNNIIKKILKEEEKNSRYSYLCLPSSGITGMYLHTQQYSSLLRGFSLKSPDILLTFLYTEAITVVRTLIPSMKHF